MSINRIKGIGKGLRLVEVTIADNGTITIYLSA